MKIVKVNQEATVTVFGVPFHGVNEISRYANSGESKQGIFVGEDYQRYPCFDFEDYASESRFFSNFIFAKSYPELRNKMRLLKSLRESSNYRKLYISTPEKLLPMIYFEGDKYHMLEIGINEDITI